jgi:hypothetical protein
VQKRTRRRHGKCYSHRQWASTSSANPALIRFSVSENPPSPDLNKDECERVVMSLILVGLFNFRIAYNAHCTLCYIELSADGHKLTTSRDPTFVVGFPKRKPERRQNTGSTATGTRKVGPRKAVTDKDGWLSSQSPAKKKTKKPNTGAGATKQKAALKKATTAKKRKRGSTVKGKPKTVKSRVKGAASSSVSSVIIELSSSDDSSAGESKATRYDSGIASRATRPRVAPQKQLANAAQGDPLWDESQEESDNEYEFDG